MRVSSHVSATLVTVAVLSGGIPIASAQPAAGGGAYAVTCGTPTADQCHDEEWISSACGVENADMCQTTWASDASSYSAPQVISAMPAGFTQAEMGWAYDDPTPPKPMEITPDPRSYMSMALADTYAAADGFAMVGPHEGWAANGTQIRSCDEYVYEKYYGLTRFLRYVGTDRDDARRILNAAYADTAADWAIGTRHENWDDNQDVAGFDGVAVPMNMWPHTNIELGIPPTRHAFFRTLPAMLDAGVRRIHTPGKNALNHIDGLTMNQRGRERTWTSERLLHENLTYEGRPVMGPAYVNVGGNSNAPFAVDPDNDAALAAILGASPGTGAPRRYLDDELNEWYRRGERFRELIRQWHALDERFEGSGWTVAMLATDSPEPASDGFAIETRDPYQREDDDRTVGQVYQARTRNTGTATYNRSGSTTYNQVATTTDTRSATPTRSDSLAVVNRDPEEPGLVGATSRDPGYTINMETAMLQDEETAARRRIVLEIGALLSSARNAGCLEAGVLGPCDFSPEGFATNLLNRLGDRIDGDAVLCESFADEFNAVSGPHPLDGFQGVVVAYSPTPGALPADVAAAVTCSVTAPASFTRASFEQFMANVKDCQFKREQGEALEAASGEALQALHDEDEEAFFDEQGRLRPTDWQTSATEILGSENFGVGMSYDIGYGIERDPDHELLDPSVCDAQFYVKSYTSVDAYVRNQKVELVVVDAAVDTRDDHQRASLRAKIIGYEEFQEGATWGGGGNLDWNLVDTGVDWEKEQKIIDFTYWIGPVPVGIEAGIAGRVGVELEVSAGLEVANGSSCLGGEVNAQVRPFAGVSGYVFLGLDIWIAKVGMRGFLTIIELGVPLEAAMTLGVTSDGPDMNVTFGVETTLDIDITTLSGRIELFAEAFGKEWSKTLVSWPGFTTEREIFSHGYEIDLITLHNAFEFAENL